MMNPMMNVPKAAHGQDAVIMVDTAKINQNQQQPNDGDKKSGKKNKRKNKNKKNDENKGVDQKNVNAANNKGSNIVTLRNPMFHGVNTGIAPPHAQGLGAIGSNRMNMGYDQPAAIIKNENGMFTIRNPALHQALSSQNPNSGYRPFNNQSGYISNEMIQQHQQQQQQQKQAQQAHLQQQQQQQQGQYSYMHPDSLNYLSEGTSSHTNEMRKCNTAIGSEMKNAQKQKKQQQQNWQPINGGGDIFSSMAKQRCYSPFEGLPYGLTSDFLATATNTVASYFPESATAASMNGAFGNIGEPYYNPNSSNAGFMGAGSHQSCDDFSPNYYDNMSQASSSNTKYDDLSFLQNLQPGQRLNSEVGKHE